MSYSLLEECITDVDVWYCKLPVNSKRDHGIGSIQNTIDVVIVRIQTESGASGFGEASPWPVFTGTAESAVASLKSYFAPLLIGKKMSDASSLMRQCEAAVVHNTNAKAAIETALLDLKGKLLSLPVHALLGGRVRESIPLSVSIANPDFESDKLLAERIYNDGIRIVKLKTGFASHEFDVMRIEWLQKHYPDFLVRVDYNQGLQPFGAKKILRDIDCMNVGFIEQPVPAKYFACLYELRSALKTPLMVDESVFSPADMTRAINEKICDAVSVKIMKSGGLSRAQEIAAIAESAGLPAYGGDMFESGLAHMAGVHMIASTPNISLGCEFYQARYYLNQDILTEPFAIENGEVPVPDSPGLGISVDLSVVDRFAHS